MGAVLLSKRGWPHQGLPGATEAARASLPIPNFNLMCSRKKESCWARAFPTMRWGFPPKNPYQAMGRRPKRQPQKWGKWEPR